MTRVPRGNPNRERDARIRAEAKTRSQSELAEEFGLSQQRIQQILATADAATQLAEREAKLQAELEELVTHAERNRRRIRAIRAILDRIAEEREAQDIDRLLGLA